MPFLFSPQSKHGFPLAALLLLLGACGLVLKFALVALGVLQNSALDFLTKIGFVVLGLLGGGILGLVTSYIQPLSWRLRLVALAGGAALGPIAVLAPVATDWSEIGGSQTFFISICAGSVAILVLAVLMRAQNPNL